MIGAVKENFDAALQNAEDILRKVQAGDAGVTQADVDAAWQNLIKAVQYLEFRQADKTDLEKVIALAEEMNRNLDAYLDAGKDAFTTALDEAKDVYEDADTMDQEAVNAAWQKLLDAMADLMLRPDKGLLEDLIARAESLNEADYDAQSFAVMRAALEAAKETAADENADQEEVNESTAALVDALAKLTAPGGGDGQQGGTADEGQSGDGGREQAAGSAENESTASGTAAASDNSAAQRSVKSGDNGSYILWCAAMMLAAGAAAAAYRRRQK